MSKRQTKLGARRQVFREERAAEKAYLDTIENERARLFKIADEAAAVAADARSAAEARRVFRETLGHKLKRWLGWD